MKSYIFRTTGLVALLVASVAGQTFRGGISGTVTDATGAAIVGASVQALNTGTQLRRESTTTNTGDFTFPDLPLGSYTLTVSQKGFDTVRVDNVAVEVGKVTGLRIGMKVA